jgi:hypothetical protein
MLKTKHFAQLTAGAAFAFVLLLAPLAERPSPHNFENEGRRVMKTAIGMKLGSAAAGGVQRALCPTRHLGAALALVAVLTMYGCGSDESSSQGSAAGKGAGNSALQAVGGPADVTQSAYSEGGKLVRADENVTALGSDLFGDRVNLYDGSVQFIQTDVSLTGNSRLPVSVGRRLSTGNSQLINGHFGDWDLEVPHLHGVFSSSVGWKVGPGVASATTNRCSQFGAPPQVIGQSNQGAFNPAEYWHGSFLYVPGSGSEEILQPNTTAAAVNPTGGLASAGVPLTTKGRWVLTCNTPLRNGAGEGFTATSPDGTQYVFDWMVSRPYSQVSRPVATAPQAPTSTSTIKTGAGGPPAPNAFSSLYLLKRIEVWILPGMVIDRFGNKVTYNWDPANPRRLNSIVSSLEPTGIARTISFTYQADTGNPALVSSVTDGTRTWTYGYTDYYLTGSLMGKTLTSVTLPSGGGTWTMAMGAIATPGTMSSGGDGSCDSAPQSTVGLGVGKMTHPSGAMGTFKVWPVMHGRSYVDRVCMGNDWDGTNWALYPKYFVSYALKSKTLTGPGLPVVNPDLEFPGGYTWYFNYDAITPYSTDPALDYSSWSTCSNCPQTKKVTTTDPQGTISINTFGTRFRVNEGQLLQTEELASGSQKRLTIHQYAAPSAGPYPDPIGYSVQPRTAGDLSTRHAPERVRTITQQGVNFNWTAGVFDQLARPVDVTRASTRGYSRRELTQYADLVGPQTDLFKAKWVLGQVKAVFNLDP